MADKESLGSLIPGSRQAKIAAEPPANPAVSSRIHVARQKTPLQAAWQGYQKSFIRTGSFMPVVHVLSGLFIMQCTVWAVYGLPPEVRQSLEGGKTTKVKPHWEHRGT